MKKVLLGLIVLLLVAFSVLAMSCGTETNDTETEETIVKISFDSKGGTEVESLEIKKGFIVYEPETPTREGYTFEGWYLNGKKRNLDSFTANEDVTFEAKWTPETYTITYVLVDGTSNSTENPVNYTAEDSIVLLNPTSIDGYLDFSGWYTDSKYENPITEIKNTKGNLTLYSKWVSNDTALIFEEKNETVAVVSCKKDATMVIIPSIYNNKPVTSIEYQAFRDCSMLTTVEIGSNVERIEENAFYWCSALKSVSIPNSVTYIGVAAFKDCSSLKSVELPNSVTILEEKAFSSCTSLESVVLSNGLTTIEAYTFMSCSSLKSIEIPEGITSISMSFTSCSALTSVKLPESLKQIGGSAFLGCSSLKSIVIPANVTTMGWQVFSKCDSLQTIFCRADSRPSGWDYAWENTSAKIVWGYTGI